MSFFRSRLGKLNSGALRAPATAVPTRLQRVVPGFARLAKSMIEAEHFTPNEQGFYCAGCAYQEACASWHRDQARARVSVAA